MAFIIVNTDDEELAWNDSNKSWESEDYDTFETMDIPLPTNGKWQPVPWAKQE